MRLRLRGKIKYLMVFACVIVLLGLLAPSYINAADNSQLTAFVTRFYVLCLDRQPDADGLNQWVTQLLDGTKTGADIAKGIIFSKEFTDKNLNNESFVTVLYKAFFDRDPDPEGFEAWVSRLNNGLSRQSAVDGFTHSQEFMDLCANYAIIPYPGIKSMSGTSSSSGGVISGSASGFAAGNAVNFIIWGDDSGMGRPGGRVNGRTDMNLFIHLNLDTHKAVIVSIPRDTWAPIPGHSTQKINAAHAIGGNALAVSTFEQFTGMKLDFYVITDFDGFIPLINYLGGVTTTVEENIADSFSGCYLNAGTVTVDGAGALALCRARHGRSLYGGGAYAREHQAGMLIADLLVEKKGMVNSGNLGDFLNAMSQFVWSNISLNQAARILPVLLSMNREDISVTTFPSWPQSFGAASAVGYNVADKNAFFRNISMQ
ncbi:MAG: LCP family protein [Actinobacteria bacterium]|nr:LCP family protein [Actinomycetota bacterium]